MYNARITEKRKIIHAKKVQKRSAAEQELEMFSKVKNGSIKDKTPADLAEQEKKMKESAMLSKPSRKIRNSQDFTNATPQTEMTERNPNPEMSATTLIAAGDPGK